MEHPSILYGLTAILGALLLSPLLESFRRGAMDGGIVLQVFFMTILGTVFLVAGLCGVGSHHLKNNQSFSALQARLAGDSRKYSKFFRTVLVIGAAFLCAFPTIGFLQRYMDFGLFVSIYNYYVTFILFCLFGGAGFLTIGVCGIARQRFKNYPNLFTILVATLIPSSILMPFIIWWTGSLTVGL